MGLEVKKTDLPLSRAYTDAQIATVVMEPLVYAGGESVRHSNGLITKRGKTDTPAGNLALGQVNIVFTDAFPNALLSMTVTLKVVNDLDNTARISIWNPTVNGFTAKFNASVGTFDVDGFYWTAEGY